MEFDASAQAPLNPTQEGYLALGAGVLSNASESVAALPLAAVTGERSLPLVHGVNPAWAAALQLLREQAVEPVFGTALTTLSEEQWEQLKTTLAQCQQWLAACPATPLGTLTEAEVQALLGSGQQAALMELLDHDEAEKEHSLQAMALEKLKVMVTMTGPSALGNKCWSAIFHSDTPTDCAALIYCSSRKAKIWARINRA